MRAQIVLFALAASFLTGCDCNRLGKTGDGGAGPLTGVQTSLSVTPTSLDFGNVGVGQQKTLTVKLKNLTTIAIDMLDGSPKITKGPGAFSLAGTPPTVVPAAGDATVSVTFAPTAEGAASGVLEIDTDATEGSATVDVPLTGNGTPNFIVAVNPIVLDFGEVYWKTTSTKTFQITNNGTEAALLSPLALSPGTSSDFAVRPLGDPATDGGTTLLAAAETRTAVVTYTPEQPEAVAGSVVFTAASVEGTNPAPVTVKLSGACEPNLYVFPTSMGFGTVCGEVIESFQVENQGFCPLTWSASMLSPPDAGFVLGESADAGASIGGVLPPDGGTNVPVAMVTDTAPAYQGEALVTSDAPDAGATTIGLSGQMLAGCPPRVTDAGFDAGQPPNLGDAGVVSTVLPPCDECYSIRVFPNDTDAPIDPKSGFGETCTDITGRMHPATGPGDPDAGIVTADFYGCCPPDDCGTWKEYPVTPGRPIKVISMAESCGGCFLIDDSDEIEEWLDGGWQPTYKFQNPNPQRGEKNVTYYVPKTIAIRVVSLGTSSGGGCHVAVCEEALDAGSCPDGG